MTLSFYPHAGMMLFCDFKGSIDPEINKKRPVIVVSPRLPNRAGLCTIVPTSTTEPRNIQPYQVLLSKNYHPKEKDDVPVWAKCDLVANVSIERLDRFRVSRAKFIVPKVTAEDLASVRQGVLAALGFPSV